MSDKSMQDLDAAYSRNRERWAELSKWLDERQHLAGDDVAPEVRREMASVYEELATIARANRDLIKQLQHLNVNSPLLWSVCSDSIDQFRQLADQMAESANRQRSRAEESERSDER
ncbi:hypothetical protein [Saccharopolyspora pogona]|uniref:hypothetical protein n=1 Tax=Saccharopolyspora pogona TaxID=333966 RepID=UPI0016892B7E|nr:hypothetical protein [Saccharopolyspora pogona]